MPSLIKTKNRLASTKSTQKVIKAMELVASSKIKKAKEMALNNKFYFDTTIDGISSIVDYEDVEYYIKKENSKEKTLVISITSDMGLCGSYNANVLKETFKVIEEEKDCLNVVVGNKGYNKLLYEKIDVYESLLNINNISASELAENLVAIINELYNSLTIKKVIIVGTKFVNPLVQEVNRVELFKMEKYENKINKELVVEPNKKFVFEQLFNQYIYCVVYNTILNSIVSEHSSRRNSMEMANTNSLELIENLNLELNRIRQAVITQEISEIIGGSEALNK